MAAPIVLDVSGRYRGPWLPDEFYATNDLIKISGITYSCLHPHVSDDTFSVTPYWEVFNTGGSAGAAGYRSANDVFYTGDASGNTPPTGEQLQAALNDGATDKRAVMARGVVTGWTTDGLQLDISATRLIADELTLDFSEITDAGLGLHVSGTNTNGAIGTYDQSGRGVEGMTEIIGPGASLASWTGILIDGSGPYPSGAHATLKGISVHEAYFGLRIGNNGYAVAFYDVGLWNNYKCLELPFGLSNAGELIDFYHSVFSNSTIGISLRNSGVDVNLYGCSVDYCKRLIEVGAAQLAMIGGHLEAGTTSSGTSDADVMIYVCNNTGTFDCRPATFVVASSRHVYPIAYCQGTEAAYDGGNIGGITGGTPSVLAGLHFEPGRGDMGRSSRTYDFSAWVKGGGRVTTGPVMKVYEDGLNVPVADSLNQIPSGDFQSVSIGTRGFKLPGSGLSSPGIDTSQNGPDGGLNSFKFRTAPPKLTFTQSSNPGLGSGIIAVPGVGSVTVAAANWTQAGMQAALQSLTGLGATTVTLGGGIYGVTFNGASHLLTGPITVDTTTNNLRTSGGTPITSIVTQLDKSIAEGAYSWAQMPLECEPGDSIQLDFWLKLVGVTAAVVNFDVRVDWVDSQGVTISHVDVAAYGTDTVGVSTDGFEHKQPVCDRPAPAGTRSALLTFAAGDITSQGINGIVAGAPWHDGISGWMKYLTVNVP